MNIICPFQMTNFGLFQTKRVCRQQFQFDENGREFSKWVENTVGKGEIAHYAQFLLFPQGFQKTLTADTSKPGLVWERILTTMEPVLVTISIISNHTFVGYQSFSS